MGPRQKTRTRQSPVRTVAEIISVIVILALAVISFIPPFHGEAKTELDHGALTYQGQMAENKFAGQGKLKLRDQDYYVGQFKAGRFDGHGRFISHAGWSFQGDFKRGTPSGNGELKLQGKTLYKGLVKDGKLVDAN
ncbi:MORN repeat-containing protein [Loigolactobacillus zhaoyuanensis]|uniref:hypothetical protein n=1 Tax=Loigolactobacillus zhaoyuanensis TaxID=2486017 RepID=UPI000F746F69|nr:hypothetical protein [Loigolactobacillus zhaoyuanensis]